jgi:glycosyltransferase involved in cell wall biosynthesis
MNRVAILTPLPPAKTGVAHYASMVVPALTRAIESDLPVDGSVQAFPSLDGYDASDFDAVIYQLGNNPHHEWIYAEAMRVPGVVVLHDLVLHHLIVEMTLARGDADGYVAALEASHGQSGAAWARGRAAGLHSEMGNFLLPASVDVARRARAVIVHNHYAADRLRSFGVETPIHVVPHPYVAETRQFDRDALRARHGFDASHRVVGFFGFLTSAKRAEVVLEAFRIAREREPLLALLVVGEPAPNIDLEKLSGDGIVVTGYVADDEFPAYYAAADRFVNLRYPSAGETSGTLIRALDAGKPVAVSDYAQFAELPNDIAFKVPFGEGEVARLVEFFTRDFDDVGPRQRAWLEENATLERTVAGYRDALEARGESGRKSALRAGAPIPLFPRLELVATRFECDIVITVRNAGDVIRTRTYGQPEYRLIARLFDGDAVVQDQWLALPRDLDRGESVELAFPRIAKEATTLRLYDALQDVPAVDPDAWETIRVR